MTALVRYTATTLVLSQRYLAPVLLFLAAVGVLSSNGGGPLPPAYAVCAGALLISMTWLTMALVSVEDPVHRAIAVVATGDARRIVVATVVTALVGTGALTLAGLSLPLVFGSYAVTLMDLLVGVMGQLVAGSVGIAIGLLCSRLVVPRQGVALVVAIGVVLVVLLTPGLPPVNLMLQLMASAQESAGLIVPLGGLLIIAFAVLVGAATVTHVLAVRRD